MYCSVDKVIFRPAVVAWFLKASVYLTISFLLFQASFMDPLLSTLDNSGFRHWYKGPQIGTKKFELYPQHNGGRT